MVPIHGGFPRSTMVGTRARRRGKWHPKQGREVDHLVIPWKVREEIPNSWHDIRRCWTRVFKWFFPCFSHVFLWSQIAGIGQTQTWSSDRLWINLMISPWYPHIWIYLDIFGYIWWLYTPMFPITNGNCGAAVQRSRHHPGSSHFWSRRVAGAGFFVVTSGGLSTNNGDLGMGQNHVALVNIKIGGKWMFIP